MQRHSILATTIIAITVAGCGVRGTPSTKASMPTPTAGSAASVLAARSGTAPAASQGLGTAVSVLASSKFAAFDAGGVMRFSLPAGVLSGDDHRLVRAEIDGDHTNVDEFGTVDGRRIAAQSVAGRLDVAAVSFDGTRVALADATYTSTANGELAPGRTTTRLAVLNVNGSTPLTFSLAGNWSPEAFTAGRNAIAAIEFLPPEHPTSYRVRIIDLSPTPTPSPPLAWNTKTPLEETMAGVRGSHVLTEQGRFLYTLYRASGGTAFVHALNLDYGGQYCIDLPTSAGLDHGTGAITASPDGQHLYVLSSTGKLITIDTNTANSNGSGSSNPVVAKLTDLSQVATAARPSIAVAGSMLYASLDRHLIAVNLDTGHTAINTTDAVPSAIALEPSSGDLLAANDQAIWRIGNTAATLHLPAGLGQVTTLYSS